jgi:hypothetical protein
MRGLSPGDERTGLTGELVLYIHARLVIRGLSPSAEQTELTSEFVLHIDAGIK